MRDYVKEYSELTKAMYDETLIAYKVLENRLGSEPLDYGRCPVNGNLRTSVGRNAIRVRIEMRIDGRFTKIDRIVKTINGDIFYVKGWVVCLGRYRIFEFNKLSVGDKAKLISELNNYLNKV